MTARSPHGEFAVMNGHAPLVSVLAPGVLRLEQDSGVSVFVTGPGTLQASATGVQVLVETCDRVDEADVAELQQQIAAIQQADAPANESRLEHLKRLLEAKERYG